MNSFLCRSKYFSLSTNHEQLIPLIREIMRHFSALLLLLWSTNCKEIHAENVADENTVRNVIRKIPHSSNKETSDDAGWSLAKIGKGVPRTQRSPLFMNHFDGMPSKNFLPVFNSHHRTVLENRKYYNQSVHPGNGFRINVSTTFTANSNPVKNHNHNGELMGEMIIPRRRTIAVRKMRVEQKPTAIRTTAVEIPTLQTFKQDNSERVPLIPNINTLQSPQLSLYQQRQQLHHQQNQRIYNRAFPAASRMQQFGATQSMIYYNPWDPLGLLNNQFWRALFPGFSVPQPQSFSTLQSQAFAAPAPQIAQSLDSQPIAITKKPYLTPNQKLALCCQKKRLSPSCQNLCSYDIFSDQSLITAVISNQCPGQELETAFNCATSMADHSACCIRKGIGEYNSGRCMVFCTTHLGNPRNTMQYIDCLRVFDGIKNCYREYHTTHPNMYGDF